MLLQLFKQDIGIDLGTANTLIYVKGKGIILNEPSVVAVDHQSKAVLATGKAAKDMIGRAPDSIDVVRPLEDGVISDFGMTQVMLREFIRRVIKNNMFTRIRIVVGVPSGVTEVEKRAVEEVARQMGAKEVYILDEPMAAAIGAGLLVDKAEGCMVADIGGGTSDIAIISLGGIVTSTSIRFAGDKMNDAIITYMRKNYNIMVGLKSAEDAKIKIGCAWVDQDDPEFIRTYNIKGRDLISGLPRTVEINSLDIMKALEEPINLIIDGIKSTLEKAPPELSADIIVTGLTLAGGGALLRGLDRLIEEQTGMKIIVSEDAIEAVAIGTGKSLEHIDRIQRYTHRNQKY